MKNQKHPENEICVGKMHFLRFIRRICIRFRKFTYQRTRYCRLDIMSALLRVLLQYS